MTKVRPAKILIDNNLKTGSKEVQKVKAIIRRSVYPTNPENLSVGGMALAILVINSYKQSNKDPQGHIDLMLFFIECGSQFTLDYGDIDEDFYEVLEYVFDHAVSQIKNNSFFELYKVRLAQIEQSVRECGMGWGYEEGLQETLNTNFPGFLEPHLY